MEQQTCLIMAKIMDIILFVGIKITIISEKIMSLLNFKKDRPLSF